MCGRPVVDLANFKYFLFFHYRVQQNPKGVRTPCKAKLYYRLSVERKAKQKREVELKKLRKQNAIPYEEFLKDIAVERPVPPPAAAVDSPERPVLPHAAAVDSPERPVLPHAAAVDSPERPVQPSAPAAVDSPVRPAALTVTPSPHTTKKLALYDTFMRSIKGMKKSACRQLLTKITTVEEVKQVRGASLLARDLELDRRSILSPPAKKTKRQETYVEAGVLVLAFLKKAEHSITLPVPLWAAHPVQRGGTS